MCSAVWLIWKCWPIIRKQIKGDINCFLNICSNFKSLFVINFVSLGSEFTYYTYCGVLAQGQWKHAVEISNLSQLPIIPLDHDIVTISLPIIYFLRMTLEDTWVRQVKFVTCQLCISSSSQISSVNWSTSQHDVPYAVRRRPLLVAQAFHGSDLFLSIGSSGNRGVDILWSAMT